MPPHTRVSPHTSYLPCVQQHLANIASPRVRNVSTLPSVTTLRVERLNLRALLHGTFAKQRQSTPINANQLSSTTLGEYRVTTRRQRLHVAQRPHAEGKRLDLRALLHGVNLNCATAHSPFILVCDLVPRNHRSVDVLRPGTEEPPFRGRTGCRQEDRQRLHSMTFVKCGCCH